VRLFEDEEIVEVDVEPDDEEVIVDEVESELEDDVDSVLEDDVDSVLEGDEDSVLEDADVLLLEDVDVELEEVDVGPLEVKLVVLPTDVVAIVVVAEVEEGVDVTLAEDEVELVGPSLELDVPSR